MPDARILDMGHGETDQIISKGTGNCPFGRLARSRGHITFFAVLVDVEALTFNLGRDA